MSGRTHIEWAEMTWNPMVGCTKVSPGCKFCYAETMAERLKAMGAAGYQSGFKLSLIPERLGVPLRRRKPTIWFVNSMSDLFHERVPFAYVEKIFEVVEATPQHIYQVLTKRPARMERFFSRRAVPRNSWIGVTVEDRKFGVPRIDTLREIDAHIRFLSVEPLLENLGTIDLRGIDWVIVGGESGTAARPMAIEWARSIRDQCATAGIPFFFKQWGTHGPDGMRRMKRRNGRTLDGETHDAMPLVLEVGDDK